MEEDWMSSEEDYSSSDRESPEGFDNEDSDTHWVPPKAPSCKVHQTVVGCFSGFLPFFI